jgi:beta-phosphoglucomutase family hydrolase
MLKAVIFDLDGVIIDSEPFHWEVNKKIFRDLGIDISSEAYGNYIGVSNTNMWTELKEKHRLPQSVNQLTALQVSGNIDFMQRQDIKPIDGVLALIDNLSRENVAIGLASSSPYTVINIVLSAFGIKRSFDAIVSGEDFQNGKPAPDIFLKAAELLNVSPQCCVVIEDSAHGVAAALAAGMKCIGLAGDNSGGQDLTKATLIVGSLRNLTIEGIRALA